MNNEIDSGDYSIGNDQLASNGATIFTNSLNMGETIPLAPQTVPDSFPNMGTFFDLSSADQLHPNPAALTSSSNLNNVSTGNCTQESSRFTVAKHARAESDDHEEETRQRKQHKRALSRMETNGNGSSERRRRERLKEKMAALKELLPNTSSSKSDQASLLDQAIRHIRCLQSHLQVLSMAWNPRQISAGSGETASVPPPKMLELFHPLLHLLMEKPMLPPAYLNPHHFLHLNQSGIWAPSTHQTLLSRPTFVDSLSAAALPTTFGSGIIHSVPPHPNHLVSPGSPNFPLVPEDVQDQASFHEDPFPVIQHYPPC